MPKMKTNRAAAKRFRKTGSGKIMIKRAMHSHMLECKRSGKKRHQRKEAVLAKSDLRRVKRLLPSL
ncbi:MAG: 50S ribosomal protein L35 [Candidatus Saganbacteria bacterium]|nr:50S ribosomal protein L35 [Candidatus Saganbacteria bacterium]